MKFDSRDVKNDDDDSSASTKSSEKSSSSSGVNKNTSKKIIRDFTSSDFHIKKLRNDGGVIVEVKPIVSIIDALKSKVNILQVSFSRITTRDSTKKRKSPSDITDEIRKNHLETKKRNRDKDFDVIKVRNIDLSSKISNKVAGKLAKAENEESAGALFDSEISYEIVESPDTVELAVYQAQKSDRKSYAKRRDTTISQVGLDLLYKDNLSPGSLISEKIPFNSTEESMAGVSRSVKNPESSSRTTTDERKKDYILYFLNGEVISDAPDKKKNDPRRKSFIVPKKKAKISISPSCFVYLTKHDLKKLGRNFIVTVTAFNKRRSAVQKISCQINLGDLINKFQSSFVAVEENLTLTGFSYKKSPTKAMSEEGKEPNKEEFPKFVNVWTKSYNSLQPLNDIGWKNLGVVSAERVIRKDLLSSRGGSHTAIRITNKDATSPVFSEILIPSTLRHLATAPGLLGNAIAETDNRFVSVTTFLRKDGVTVRLSGFQSTYTVSVVRKNLTLKDRAFTFIDVVDPFVNVDQTTGEIIFVDSNVKVGHIYEYKAKIFTREGREILSPGSSLIKYRRVEDNIALVSIENLSYSENEIGEINVKFDINVELSETNVTAIVEILSANGLTNYFVSDIEANRELLKKAIAFHIQRSNLTLGVTEEFKIFTKNSFSDKENRSLTNVSPLIEGHSYRYVVSVLARDTETMIPSIKKEKRDEGTSRAVLMQPAKYLHPETLGNGTLRSNFTMKNVRMDEEFLAGFTGVQVFLDVTIPSSSPSIVGGSCSKNGTNNAEIRWQVAGNIDQIDHFIVIAEQLGSKVILGKVHPASLNNTYSFEDKILSNMSGRSTYFVIPVFNDFSLGKPVELGSLTTTEIKKRV